MCCKTSFKLCDQRQYACMESLLVAVPPTYTDSEITILFTSESTGAQLEQTLEPLNGFVEIDLSELQGFFNPYGQKFYNMQFLGLDLQPFQFVAQDGNTYDEVVFQVSKISKAQGIVDVFGTEPSNY